MLDLLDLQNFAAQAQQLTKKLSSLPDPPVVRRGADLFGWMGLLFFILD